MPCEHHETDAEDGADDCEACELGRECVRLRVALAEVGRELARADGWVLRGVRLVDHACGRCLPGGPMVTDDFVCVWHAAQARQKKRATLSTKGPGTHGERKER